MTRATGVATNNKTPSWMMPRPSSDIALSIVPVIDRHGPGTEWNVL
jgi:hypothetical protein